MSLIFVNKPERCNILVSLHVTDNFYYIRMNNLLCLTENNAFLTKFRHLKREKIGGRGSIPIIFFYFKDTINQNYFT